MKLTPLIKFTILYALGIVVGKYISFDITVLIWVFSSGVLFLGVILFLKTPKSFQRILLYFLIIVVGASNSVITFQKIDELSLPFKDLDDTEVYCEIQDILLPNENVLRYVVKVDSIDSGKALYGKEITALLNVKSKSAKLHSLYKNAEIGDKIIFTGSINQPSGQRNPGEFNYREYLAQKRISAVCYTKLNSLELVKSNTGALYNIFTMLRKGLDKRISELHSDNSAGLLRGVLLADRSDISYEVKASFINSGIVHILAVSGLHVGFVILVLYLFTARVNIHLRYALILAGLAGFLIITGCPVSAARASVMAVILLTANYFDRNYNTMNSLFIAVLVILIYDPSEMFTAGFQLSVSAVFSIIYFSPLFREWLNKFNLKSKYLKNLILFIAVSFFAQIGTLPFTVIYFHKISVISLLSNLVAVPLIGVILGNSFLTISVSFFSSGLSNILAQLTNLMTEGLYIWGDFWGNMKFSYISNPGLSLFEGAFYFIIIFSGLTYLMKNHLFKMKMLVLILVCANIFVLFASGSNSILKPNNLSVLTVDVGQGDAIILKFPDGKSALIDAGNAVQNYDCGKRILEPLLEYLEIEKLDYLFISHLDADHYKGSISLIQDDITDTVYVPSVDSSSEKERDFNDFLHKNGDIVKYYTKSSLCLGNAKIYFLVCPDIDDYNSNNRSGILKVCYGNTSALFTGDAEIKVEKKLITQYRNLLDSDFLKVGHHGSRHGTGKPFLQWVTPEYSIVSAGKNNRYHHPSKEVIDNLVEAGSTIYRTDKEGAILMVSDGKTFKKVNWRDL